MKKKVKELRFNEEKIQEQEEKILRNVKKIKEIINRNKDINQMMYNNIKDNKRVYNEIYDIISHMESRLTNKIPKDFIKLIEQNRDENIKVNIDYSKSINEQELQRETRVVLSLIYRDYLCSEEERNALIEKDKKELESIEAELREKYNPDNLFKKAKVENTEEKDVNTNKDMLIYKENIIQKIFRKLKKIFGLS